MGQADARTSINLDDQGGFQGSYSGEDGQSREKSVSSIGRDSRTNGQITGCLSEEDDAMSWNFGSICGFALFRPESSLHWRLADALSFMFLSFSFLFMTESAKTGIGNMLVSGDAKASLHGQQALPRARNAARERA
ncbi:hypothetical protein O1611_g6438 [Lasiodiplodia mahajangana]|uniref:Uncharacterized protein n=1 Tax=Lasiodiplodia mahajangana TaxID=1108764 RepID=A0ACC2JIE1_9PEZI|nr:hypothetical protein O1611_g6438 [Lasiodiplodia mahajangana]